MKRSIEVPGLSHGSAPIPMGARIGPLICSSALNGKDRTTGALPAEGPAQVKNIFSNLLAFLKEAGADTQHVVKLSIYLKDDSLRGAINEQWLAMYPDAHDRPARHISNYDLQHGMLIQLEVIAYVNV